MTIYPDEYNKIDRFKLEYLNQINTVSIVDSILAEEAEASVSASAAQSEDEWSDSDELNTETAANSKHEHK